MKRKEIDQLVSTITQKFSCFGGGKASNFNPIANALTDKPPMFAAGVDVENVVRFILKESKKLKRKSDRKILKQRPKTGLMCIELCNCGKRPIYHLCNKFVDHKEDHKFMCDKNNGT
jgi:hypothetical protein